MFLKSLALHGFKSFAQRVELTFPPGVSAVVGPNGSGKSNIADAFVGCSENRMCATCVEPPSPMSSSPVRMADAH